MERMYYLGIEYFVAFYALLIVARIIELYKDRQTWPPFLHEPITVDEFLGPQQRRNEYWFMPLWAIAFIVLAVFIACVAASFLAIVIGGFLLVSLMRTLWNLLVGKWAYWPFPY